MEKFIGFFFIFIICVLIYITSNYYKKKYNKRVKEFDNEIQIIRKKISVLEQKFDTKKVEKEELSDLTKQVLYLHQSLIQQFINK